MPESTLYTNSYVADNLQELLTKPSSHFHNLREEMLFALSILDLTTLEGSDNQQTIEQLCNRAAGFRQQGLPNVAAVCVYPVFVGQAKQQLKDTGIRVASVAGAFPSGQSPLHIKLEEIKYAVAEGADEIDMVISRGKFLEGNYTEVFDEIKAIKEACGEAHLKVILETGELKDHNLIYDASILAMKAGADFIKTSTGKITVSATLEAAFVMLNAIKDHYTSTGRKVGFKPAGGIAETHVALQYTRLAEHIAGPEWLTAHLLRIGASRLAGNLVQALGNSTI